MFFFDFNEAFVPDEHNSDTLTVLTNSDAELISVADRIVVAKIDTPSYNEPPSEKPNDQPARHGETTMRPNRMGTLLLYVLCLLIVWTGCSSNKPKAPGQDPDALRKYVNTSSGWVSDKLTAAGVTLGSPRETLADFVKQENYRVCRMIGDDYLHALVPNSKIHPGEQDIHIVALFGPDGKVQQLDVTTQTFSVENLNKECP